MPYYRPVKTIASVAGLPGTGGAVSGGVVIVSKTEPSTRDNGSELRNGDFWFQPDDELTYIYVDGEWQIIGSNVDYGGDFIIDGGDSGGNGFINNNPGDGTGTGSGVTNTADLKLAFFDQNPFQDLRVVDLPDSQGIEFQSDANTWFLEAILLHHSELETIEENLDNLNNLGANINFQALAPITVDVGAQTVVHGFDMTKLSFI